MRKQDNRVWWKGEKVSKKRVLMQVRVAQCIALRASTQAVEVSIPSEEDRKNFWDTIIWKWQNFRLELSELQWIARWTSDPDVAGSNPTYDDTNHFLVRNEAKEKTLNMIHENCVTNFQLTNKD